MIPNCGPTPTESEGERLIYHLLRAQLSDDFTVIHSLPWLSAAAREIAGVKAVTGEVDFLIVHAELGVLALEVKGGLHKVQGLAFVHVKTGTTTRAVEQVRASAHGLARWLGMDPSLRLRIGYALAFPHSDFSGKIISTALTDVTVEPPGSLVIDKLDGLVIGERIIEVMTYWKKALSNPSLGQNRMKALIEAVCPSYDGTPSWASRVIWDNKFWLRLTPEQSAVVDEVATGNRQVVTGWPGTGKTLILIESARRLLSEGKSVLVLTFNTLLADHIRSQIGTSKLLRVSTWHSFCRSAASRLQGGELERDWLDRGCLEDISCAAQQNKVRPADVVLVDEGQTFRNEWIQWLCAWHAERQILMFCDETQVFEFEEGRASLSELCRLCGVSRPFSLTIVLRSPHAVYQRLRSVVKPEHQLHIPRDPEIDTLEELLVIGMQGAVVRVLDRLDATGLAQSDIVVLNKFGWMESKPGGLKARFETLSRFRGMESPVIVVCGAEQMDDTEIFCAFSRATTLCIALYDAEVLGVRGANGKFHTSLLMVPENAREAEQARLSAHPKEIIQTHFSPLWLNLQSIKVGWLSEWNAWIVERRDELSEFWIDYLVSHYPWPVFFWHEHSLRAAQLASPVADLMRDSPGGTPYHLLPCDQCSFMTPQRMNPSHATTQWECLVCIGPQLPRPRPPRSSILDRMGSLDRLVAVRDPKSLTAAQRKVLPLSLAAGAALLSAERNATRELVGLDQMSSGRVTYRAALGFVYSLVNLLPAGKSIEVAAVAKELYGRYLIPNELTLEKWKQDFALACGLAYRRGYFKKLAKGLYAPTRSNDPSD